MDLKIFSKNVESEALNQIYRIASDEAYKGNKIRIMPDVHGGADVPIGFTMEFKNCITPSFIGVDIGCGMLTIELDSTSIDLEKLDKVIHEYVPAGFSIHDETPKNIDKIEKLLDDLKCKSTINKDRALKSLGTLGGGNHFIEVSKSSLTGKIYLIIHSGSRNLGVQICRHYENIAKSSNGSAELSKNIKKAIKELKKQGKQNLIQAKIKELKEAEAKKPKSTFNILIGKHLDDYLHDMKIAQLYASDNRKRMAKTILEKLNLQATEIIETIHNYIDFSTNIIRKGSISAKKDELVVIPINMKEGSLLCIGKGNEDWNYSAPHGAGRVMSRSEAKKKLSLEDFKKEMEGIYTTCISSNTLDEAPMAYKTMNEIVSSIGETVKVVDVLKPIYNFKANS